MFRKLLQDRTGATAVEYALVASIISVAALGAFLALGQQSSKQMSGVRDAYAEVN